MSDPLSVGDIAAARNQKLAAEQTDTARIAAELEGAHQDALALKHQLRQQEGEAAVPQQQAFPHGSAMASAVPSQEHTGVGETVAEGIANADQGVTTALHDAVHRASEGVSAAGTAAANAAGAAVDKTKEALQSTLGARAAANAEGGTTKGYEGAVFSSDDPEYKDASGGVTESRTPAHTLDELKASSPNPIISSPKEDTPHFPNPASLLGLGSTNKLPRGRQPAIATPTEPAQQPASLGEGSVGIAAGDPKGGANVVAAAHTVSKGVVSSIKDAFSGSTGGPVAGAPAGPSDPDPCTANVPVGDFRALHEALGIATSDGSSAHHKGSSGSSGDAPAAAAAAGGGGEAVSRGTTDQDNAGALPSAQEMREGWEGLKSQAQEGLEAASDRVQQSLESASQRVEAAVGPEGGSSSSGTWSAGGGGGFLGGLAGIESGIANKVNLANNSEELLAGGAVPDAAASPAAADGPTAAPAPEVTGGDATAAAKGAAADATAAAKGTAADATDAVKQGAAELRDRASETAGAAAASVRGAAESVREAAGDAAGRAADAAQSAKDSTADAAASARDSAAGAAGEAAGRASGAAESVREAAGNAAERAADAAASARDSAAEAAGEAAGRVSGAAEQAKESAGGSLSSLVQGAKEGFVGAYDKAAAVLVGDDKPSPPATDAGNNTSQDTPAAAQPPSNIAGLSGDSSLQSGAVGSGHAAVPQAGIGAVLKQGWEDLKHGGAKAPHAVSTGGETAASYDVTSNIERSKHLDDPQQAKIYKAEVYAVSPGSQAASDQAATDARKTGPVAGDRRAVTGAVPHDKPDTSKVHADQTTRFDGNKGMATGFGTGSAAPYSGDTSIKDVAALFAAPHSSLDMGGLSTEEQQALVEVAAQAGASAGRQDSSSEAGLSSWVSSMSAVWRNLGVASAKGPGGGDSGSGSGPSTQELKDNIQWDNPTQDAVIDPVRGVTKKEGHSPGHKIQMRTGEQIPPDSNPSDPQFFKDKAERAGKVVSDTLTTSSEEAAADSNNLKGKSSDNKPDGLAHFTKHEAQEAAAAVGCAPEAAASALGTAGAIVSGVAGHFVDKAKELGHNITQHGDFLSAEERTAKSQAAVERVEKQMEQLGNITSDHRAVQELQEERMAAIGDPAHKRETLGDKIIGPMVSDASDDTHARELAASYKEWEHDKQRRPSDTAAGSSGGSGGSSGGGSSSSVGGAVRDLKQEAGDTARSTKEVVQMEGQAAGEGVQAAANQAGSKVGGAIDSVKGLATEAADTAHAAGEVVSMEVSEAADAVRGKTDQAASSGRDTADAVRGKPDKAASSVRDTARDVKQSAQDTAQRASDSVRDTARDVKQSAQDTAQHASDSVRDTARDVKQSAQDTAQRASDSACDTADRTAAAAKDAAHRTGDSTRQTTDAAKGVADSAGEKLQEGVDAVAHGTGFVAGAGAEKLSEAQEAAARAGDKVGSAAGGVLAGVADTARGLLGALMGPFEREGAFDESTAALTGPRQGFEPVGAEQVSGLDVASTQAPAVERADSTTTKTTTTTVTTTGSGRSAGVAAAPAGADTQELQGRVQRGLKETEEAIRARVQAGIDDTAYATGVTAGHIESVVETGKQQIAAVTEDIHVPPAELTTNTEDLLRQRQQQLGQ